MDKFLHAFKNAFHYDNEPFVPEEFMNVDIIEATPMLFSADWDFAYANGGDLTRTVMNHIEDDVFNELVRSEMPYAVIDTKVCMLMEGMYPAIPGWHCDANPRNKRYAQPDVENANPEGYHWVCNVSDRPDGTSSTLFLNVPAIIEVDRSRVWGSVNEEVDKQFGSKFGDSIPIWRAPDRCVVKFDQRTLHTAAPTHNSGWRWFFRCSLYHNPPLNKIRHQVQVYANSNKGW